MGLTSWMREFYPVKASKAAKLRDNIEMLKHAELKWRGLQKEALKKHAVWTAGCQVRSNRAHTTFVANSQSCALCHVYLGCGCCTGCPLVSANNGRGCDENSARSLDSPWSMFALHNDPEPMLRLIQKALRRELRKLQ